MITSTTLTTERLTLRQPLGSDLPAYTAYCASPRTQFVGGPFDAVQAFDKLAAMSGHWTLRGFGRYVMEHDGTPIGHVGPMQLDATQPPELTWTLWDGAYEKRGLATEAAHRVRDHLMHDLSWPQLLIHIMPDNASSIGIAQRIGATRSAAPAHTAYEGALVFELKTEVPA